MSDSLQSHGLQHNRLPCPSLSPGVCANPCLLSQWCHPIILFSVVPFSTCPQSFPESGSFPMSWFFTSSGQSTGASASALVLKMNIQDRSFRIDCRSKGLSRVFSNIRIQKHQFFTPQPFFTDGIVVKWKSLSHVWHLRPYACSPQGSSVHGILQARILEWVAISFSRIGHFKNYHIQSLKPLNMLPYMAKRN